MKLFPTTSPADIPLTMRDDFEYRGVSPHKRRRIEPPLRSRDSDSHSYPTRDSTPRDARRFAETSDPRADALPADDMLMYQEDERLLDRDWYGGDDLGGHVFGDESHNPFASWDAAAETAAVEKMSYSSAGGRFDARREQRRKENDAWETNRMLVSGVAQRRLDSDFALTTDDDDDSRIHLLVHNIRPPFLDGRTIFTKQLDPVPAVRDYQSDMAVFSRKGSKVVREMRQQRERQRQAKDATNVAGTALGNLMGVKEDDADSALPMAGEDDKAHLAAAADKSTATTEGAKIAQHMDKNGGGASTFSRTKSLREQREFLPAFAVREDLLRVVRENQVTIIVGETGSGKTTQLTQFLMEEGYGRQGLIACTQPRRVAAMSVAKRVADEMEVKLGTTVGYSIRFEDCTSADTVIKYMTEGILLRESLTDPDLDRYACIIMDEAHERALNTDILMGLFKQIIRRRRDLKLIVTSATMNSKRFSDFFGGAPEFTIPGRTFPVDVLFSKSPIEDFVDQAVHQILAIHVSMDPGDILAFMTGQEDIEVTCELVQKRLDALNNPPKLSILPLYSQMPADLQARIFERAPAGVRKLIVSTNVAETSLTVDGIRYVVDAGYCKMRVYNPKIGMDALQVTPISQANANQRSGRAGRTGPGKAFRLYTETAFKDELYISTIPEIQRTNLSNTVLMLKSLGVKDLLDFDFLDPPPQETISTSLFDLWALGALDHLGELTELGRKMTAFPMEPSMSKLLIMSAEYGCTDEMVTIVAMLSVPNVFYRPQERQEEADVQREKFWVHESDHLTYLQVYTAWKAHGFSDRWCSRHFLHAKSLRRAREIRQQLVEILAAQKVALASCGMDSDVVRKCICSGYYHQAARAKAPGEYVNLRTNLPVQLHPTSSLNAGHAPEFVVYHELILTSKVYVSTVTAVDPHWLAEMGGVFYSVREKAYSQLEKRVIQREWSQRMEIEEKMAEDRKRDEQRKQAEADREEAARRARLIGGGGGGQTDGGSIGNGEIKKRIVTSGAVKKVIRKRGFRGF